LRFRWLSIQVATGTRATFEPLGRVTVRTLLLVVGTSFRLELRGFWFGAADIN
jgi:hypothetical protein